jgi:hypothetical protein
VIIERKLEKKESYEVNTYKQVTVFRGYTHQMSRSPFKSGQSTAQHISMRLGVGVEIAQKALKKTGFNAFSLLILIISFSFTI